MVRLKQALIITVGLVAAAAMVVLGIWQLDVYKSQGNSTATAKAAAPPVPLMEAAPVGSAVRGSFGRSVQFRGSYEPELQVFVASGGGQYRVLTGLVQIDGSIVPIVRGLVPSISAPPPPSGQVEGVGVLLPSEDDAPVGESSSLSMDAVRLPVLAQRWSGQLIGGFVTLPAAASEAQGLASAPLALPEAKGRLRNGAYAFQWWLFGAFAVFMSIRMARDFGLRDDLEDAGVEDEVSTAASTNSRDIGS